MAVIASIQVTDQLAQPIAGTSISIPIGSESVHIYNTTGTFLFISLTEAGVDIATQRVLLSGDEGRPIEYVFPARLGQQPLFLKAGDGAAPNAYVGYVIV